MSSQIYAFGVENKKNINTFWLEKVPYMELFPNHLAK